MALDAARVAQLAEDPRVDLPTISEGQAAATVLILGSPGDGQPSIACPSWCVASYEQHLAELSDLDGLVHHFSTPVAGVFWSRETYPNGSASDEGSRVYVEAQQGLTVAEAETLAQSLLAVVKEASR